MGSGRLYGYSVILRGIGSAHDLVLEDRDRLKDKSNGRSIVLVEQHRRLSQEIARVLEGTVLGFLCSGRGMCIRKRRVARNRIRPPCADAYGRFGENLDVDTHVRGRDVRCQDTSLL